MIYAKSVIDIIICIYEAATFIIFECYNVICVLFRLNLRCNVTQSKLENIYPIISSAMMMVAHKPLKLSHKYTFNKHV